ncbi:MAG: acyl-[acyl-carrier-protein]--UDP-N-acetylglucosamine O-acyltransferase [Deltaproteobacteria bacterium RIFOXYD12_FULL_50_9]|nr:MAG: acyl-[acyl-carrier-protein]--UDP-N-acetylglucosamine O-acyltransferase [Deltaproteobacteria bacterium RIFOXYD12_FULL_50_9]
MTIHPTALVDAGAELDSTVSVGPYAVIEKDVKIGAGTEIGSHTLITGVTTIGERNKIGPFVTVGAPPQDLKYKNEKTELIIGNDNQIREYASLHRGTPTGRGKTTLGSNNLLMAYVHIAHDCEIGNQVIMANAATLGGHVAVGDRVTLGGLAGVHQFVRIGAYAYVGGMSGIGRDIPPYVIASGMRSQMRISGLNKIGLKRCGFDADTLLKLERAYQIIFRTPELLLAQALELAEQEMPDSEPVRILVDFFRTSKRSVVRTVGDEE